AAETINGAMVLAPSDPFVLNSPLQLSFFFAAFAGAVDLASFPTRRSSDLEHPSQGLLDALTIRDRLGTIENLNVTILGDILHSRSEEHTSELQSRSDLVCRLLLEKKKLQKLTSNTYRAAIT